MILSFREATVVEGSYLSGPMSVPSNSLNLTSIDSSAMSLFFRLSSQKKIKTNSSKSICFCSRQQLSFPEQLHRESSFKVEEVKRRIDLWEQEWNASKLKLFCGWRSKKENQRCIRVLSSRYSFGSH
jgi:hypothetical protein